MLPMEDKEKMRALFNKYGGCVIKETTIEHILEDYFVPSEVSQEEIENVSIKILMQLETECNFCMHEPIAKCKSKKLAQALQTKYRITKR